MHFPDDDDPYSIRIRKHIYVQCDLCFCHSLPLFDLNSLILLLWMLIESRLVLLARTFLVKRNYTTIFFIQSTTDACIEMFFFITKFFFPRFTNTQRVSYDDDDQCVHIGIGRGEELFC